MFLYWSKRIGKNGRIFWMPKIQTLKEGHGHFAHEREYVWGGKFMRKYRIDEMPQLWCILTGNMRLFAPRPRDPREVDLYPADIREKLLSIKPGLLSLSGIYFMDEEHLLKLSTKPTEDYFTRILPLKISLDMFYIDNRCFLLNLSILYMAIKARLWN